MEAERSTIDYITTSGSTGKPKGVLHTTGGYLVYTSYTHELIFDYNPGDIYWCTADLGWITGHSYIVYGLFLIEQLRLCLKGFLTTQIMEDFGM